MIICTFNVKKPFVWVLELSFKTIHTLLPMLFKFVNSQNFTIYIYISFYLKFILQCFLYNH